MLRDYVVSQNPEAIRRRHIEGGSLKISTQDIPSRCTVIHHKYEDLVRDGVISEGDNPKFLKFSNTIDYTSNTSISPHMIEHLKSNSEMEVTFSEGTYLDEFTGEIVRGYSSIPIPFLWNPRCFKYAIIEGHVYELV